MDNRLKSITRWFIPILSVVVQCITISYALDSSLNLIRFIPILIGVLFVLIGNYLPKCRQNYTMGIKLPWTLNSEENWEKNTSVRWKDVCYSWAVYDLGGILRRIRCSNHICACNDCMFCACDLFVCALPQGDIKTVCRFITQVQISR